MSPLHRCLLAFSGSSQSQKLSGKVLRRPSHQAAEPSPRAASMSGSDSEQIR
jgi:hypothetical protein